MTGDQAAAILFGDMPEPKPKRGLTKERFVQIVLTGGVVEHAMTRDGRPRCGAKPVSRRKMGRVRGPIPECVACYPPEE